MAVNCLQRAANWRQIAIIVRAVSAATKTGKERRLQGYYTAVDVTYPFNGASRRTPPKCMTLDGQQPLQLCDVLGQILGLP